MRLCPVTGEEMRRELIHEVEVDRSSAGMWLDRTELYRITQAVRRRKTLLDELIAILRDIIVPEEGRPEDRGRGTLPRDLPCPVCGRAMFVDSFEDVSVDRCRDHGTWLDQGELELIIERLERDPEFVRGVTVRLLDAEF